jgi:hypothetical protein
MGELGPRDELSHQGNVHPFILPFRRMKGQTEDLHPWGPTSTPVIILGYNLRINGHFIVNFFGKIF